MNKIIVIVGPTAVGKTKLSLVVAKRFNGEIINADSTQIYKELNIATAKIEPSEREGVPHHLIDLKSLEEDYTVYHYQQDSRKIIENILANKKTPIMVGGTGLYIKASLYDYKFNQEKNKSNYLLYDVIFIGLTTTREKLYENINQRVDVMVEKGLIAEAKKIYNLNIKTKAVMTPIGYKELFLYFDGKKTLEESLELIKQRSRNYAKRQYTWFNNQMKINWFETNYDDFNETIKEVINYIEKNKQEF